MPVTGSVPLEATALVASVRVSGASAAGSLKIGPADANLADFPSALNFGETDLTQATRVVELGSDRKIKIQIPEASASAEFALDVHGYFTGDDEAGGEYVVLDSSTAYQTEFDQTGDLEPGEARTVSIFGAGHVPDDGQVDSLWTELTVHNWSGAGALVLTNPDADSPIDGKSVYLPDSSSAVSSLTMPVVADANDAGQVTIHNQSEGTISVTVVAKGYFMVPDGGGQLESLDHLILDPQVVTEPVPFVAFESPLANGEILSTENDAITVMNSEETLGNYLPLVVDSAGNEWPAQTSIVGNDLVVNWTEEERVEYPLTVSLVWMPYGTANEIDDLNSDSASMVQSYATYYPYTRLRSRSKKTNYTNKKQILARCRNTGGKCTLSSFKSSNRTFGVALNISISRLASLLNISGSHTVDVGSSASCESPRKLKKDEVFVAYPMGSRHKYKVEKGMNVGGDFIHAAGSPSGWRYTFNPYKTGIDCRIIKR